MIDGLLKIQETQVFPYNFVLYGLNVRCFVTECNKYTVSGK